MVADFLFSFERGNARDREKPVENTIERHKIVSSIIHTNSRDGRPSKKSRCGKRNTSEKKPLESENYRGVLDLNPLELKGSPNANQEISLGAEEGGEEREGNRIEGGEDRRAEEEGDLGSDERQPDAKEGTGLEVKTIEDVSDHET